MSPDALPPAFPARAPWGTAERLRAWQEEAIEAYLAANEPDYLVAATPGAGKTTFALRLAAELKRTGAIDRITVVAPTEHLKRQWADAAARIGIRLDPAFRNASRSTGRHFHGVAVTYAQVAARPLLHRLMTESGLSLVILDEVHHGGDALSWGDAVRTAFEPARRRVSLTGTPFRSDAAPIPFVRYRDTTGGGRVSETDFRYGYGRALQDGVVRPVVFLTYAGTMKWRTRAGDEFEARLGDPDTADVTAQAWRTALDPAGDWMRQVLEAADRRLTAVRETVPDAGGLVIASDRASARAYARMLESISGEHPTVVLSDDSDASGRIEQFATSMTRWMVAVRMVSEGVDVPRLMVGVYATSASTPLYFAQSVGRFVRARRRGEVASVFLPTVPSLLGLASELEAERDHVLGRGEPETVAGMLDDVRLEAARRDEDASDDLGSYLALESTAEFDSALFDGVGFGMPAAAGSPEELDFIGLPGILEPDQVQQLLRHREARQRRRASVGGRVATPPPVSETPPPALYRTLAEQRRLLNSLVGLRARLTNQPHGMIHAELRRTCGGPEVSKATVAQLQARIDLVRRLIG